MKSLFTATLTALLLTTAAATAVPEHSRIGDPALFGLVEAAAAPSGSQADQNHFHSRIGDLSQFAHRLNGSAAGGATPDAEFRVEASGRSVTVGGDVASGEERLLP